MLLVTTLAGASDRVPAKINPAPASLEEHYPPRVSGPVYLFRMLDLEGAFSGIAAELMADDLAGAKAQYALFRDKYRSVKGLVPEWQSAFPEGGVEALGRALEGVDKGAMFRALDGVGGVCHRCHVVTMVPAQQKYRWGSFSSLRVADGAGGEAVPYVVFKKFLAANLAGVRVDADQGQWESARKHFRSLQGRLAGLANTCEACHAQRPRAFLAPEALGLLESELGKASPQSEVVSGLLQALGGQSCAGCHLIHVPAALATAAQH